MCDKSFFFLRCLKAGGALGGVQEGCSKHLLDSGFRVCTAETIGNLFSKDRILTKKGTYFFMTISGTGTSNNYRRTLSAFDYLGASEGHPPLKAPKL